LLAILYSIVIIATQIQHSSTVVKAGQPGQVVVYLMQNLHLMERPPRIIYTRLDRRMNALQLCRWRFSHKETL